MLILQFYALISLKQHLDTGSLILGILVY